jgi:hypothetical protein
VSGGMPRAIRNRRFMDLFVSFFKWANLFYEGFVWLDAKIMPLSLSSVILIKSNILKKKNTVNARN